VTDGVATVAKPPARVNLIKDLLSRLRYADMDARLIRPNRRIVFAYDGSSTQVTQP